MDVELTLFPRADMRVVGIAPLTSMFLFDETNRGRLDDYRPEVHDSDGLQITSKSGEHIFRQLANPTKLQVSTFTTQPPQGFGLVQRSRDAERFPGFRQPVRAAPERLDRAARAIGARARWSWWRSRPGGRATTTSSLSGGRRRASQAGHPAEFAYRLTWLAEPALPKGLGEVVATRSGASLDGKRRVFILDFVGAGEKTDGLRLDLGASRGQDFESARWSSNSALHGLRASFEVDPGNADLIELRLRILRGDRPVTETWLYRWTAP